MRKRMRNLTNLFCHSALCPVTGQRAASGFSSNPTTVSPCRSLCHLLLLCLLYLHLSQHSFLLHKMVFLRPASTARYGECHTADYVRFNCGDPSSLRIVSYTITQWSRHSISSDLHNWPPAGISHCCSAFPAQTLPE